MKDYEKQAKRKLVDVENTVVENQVKLDQLNEANESMKVEIENLKKIYELTNEQIKLQKQIKNKEIQVKSKSSQQMQVQDTKQLQQQQGNIIDPSLIGNELLQEIQKTENEIMGEQSQIKQDSERNVKCKFNYIFIL